MLLSCRIRKWLKKMSIVGCTHLNGPFLHAFRYLVSNTSVKLSTMQHRSLDSLKCLLRHVSTHFVKVKHILSEIFRYRCVLCIESTRLMGCSLVQSSFSKCCHNCGNLSSRAQRYKIVLRVYFKNLYLCIPVSQKFTALQDSPNELN